MAEYNITSGVTSTGLTLNGDNMRISNGGLAIDTAINTGNMYVSSGGRANSTMVNSDGYMTISGGGRANSTTVNSKAMLQVCGGGRADAVKVNSTGWMSVSSGATATKIVENGGYVTFESGAKLLFVPNTFSGVVLESASATVHKNTTATDTTLNTGGMLYVISGGSADKVTVNSGGSMVVSSGATATEILENGGCVSAANGANVKFKANKLTGLVLEKTNVTVHSGTAAEKFTLRNYGNLYVYTGTANSTTVDSYGYLYVSGGKADKVTVNSNGNMTIFAGTATNVTFESGGRLDVSGGKADKVTLNSGGWMHIRSGGSATGVVWTPCEGHVAVYGGGTVKFKNKLSGVYYGSGGKQLEHDAVMDGRTLDSGCELVVMNGGTATNATVNSGGSIYVHSGGRADDAIVNSGGSICVYTGGAADHATLNESGRLFLYGATADQTAVESGGDLCVYEGGMAKNTTVNGGKLNVYSGGTAKRVAMSGGASLQVYGGTALGVDWTPCEGRVEVSNSGGSVSYRNSRFSGVYFGDGSSLQSHAAVMDGKTLDSGYEMYVYSGGMANNTTVNSSGAMYVSSGGMADNVNVLSRCMVYVYSGGLVNGGTVEGQAGGIVLSGGSANGITVNSRGGLDVWSGGVADNTTVSSGGALTINTSGTARNTTVSSGGYLSATHNGTMLENVRIESGGSAVISGTMENFTAEFGARVSLGGMAHNVRFGGGDLNTDMVISGTVTDFTLEAKNASVASRGVVEQASVNGGFLYVGGLVNGALVNSGGHLMVLADGGSATNVTVSEGGVMIDYGSGCGATIQEKGFLCVSSGGMLADVTVLTGGILQVNSTGILTGAMSFATGANVTLSDGAGVVFDVSGLTAADCSTPFLSDYSLLNRVGDQSWKIAVSAVQSFGTYTLADWADGFDKPVTVVNDAWKDTGITLEVDVTKNIFGADHTLRVIGSKLVLIVGESENTEPADTGWNDTLYDKKTKQVNKAVYGMDALAVTADTRELLIDTAGTVRALDDRHNFIGNSPSSGRLDAADFTKIELATAAKLSFNAYSGQAAKFTVWQLTEGKDKAGATTYTLKSLQSTSLKGGYVGVGTSKKPLLLEAGEYYVSMELANANKAGEDGYYSVMIDDSPDATEFYTRADNSDDWGDMKVNGAYGRIGRLGVINEDSFADMLVSDGWVGFGDAIDYMQFSLESAAKLGFYLDATDATKFTVWQLDMKKDKNGVTTYSLKSLQSIALKAQGSNFYWADTYDKPLLLDAGTYYLSMESTNAKKGGSAAYNISLSGAVFYDRVDNGDDWGDMKTDGANGLVGDAGTLDTVGNILEDWVGYGDTVDYKQFTLKKNTSLSFSVHSEDEGKFTVWRLDEKAGKKGPTFSLKSLGTVKIAAGNTEQIGGLTLDAGTYYFSMESTNAKKGGGGAYTVDLDTFTEFDSLSAALTAPENDPSALLGFAETCAGSACGLAMPETSGQDAFAGLDDKSAWQNLASLA